MTKVERDILIEILLDKNARADERDDAAMNLSQHPDDETLNALITVGKDNRDKILWDVVGESIADIMVKKNHIQMDVIESLGDEARDAALNYIESE